jgi:hypothetical protein
MKEARSIVEKEIEFVELVHDIDDIFKRVVSNG